MRAEIRRPGSSIIGSTAYMPERYGEPTAPAIYIQHVFITAANIDAYYPAD